MGFLRFSNKNLRRLSDKTFLDDEKFRSTSIDVMGANLKCTQLSAINSASKLSVKVSFPSIIQQFLILLEYPDYFFSCIYLFFFVVEIYIFINFLIKL